MDHLRVALGSPTAPASAIWRFWVNRNDVYAASRNIAGLHKFSLHESGLWVQAFTSQSGAVGPLGDRRQRSWRRPPEFMPGWTKGPAIAFPRVDENGLTNWPRINKEVVWLPPPRIGNHRALNLLFAADSAVEPPVELGDQVGGFDLVDGQRFWVTTSERVLQDHEKRPILEIRDDPEFKIGVDDVNDVQAAAVIWYTETPDDGLPLAIEIPLTADNFYRH